MKQLCQDIDKTPSLRYIIVIKYGQGPPDELVIPPQVEVYNLKIFSFEVMHFVQKVRVHGRAKIFVRFFVIFETLFCSAPKYTILSLQK